MMGSPDRFREWRTMGGLRASTVTAALAVLLLGVAATTAPVRAQTDPFVAMNALRVTPPIAAPAVKFQALDGRAAGLEAFRGRPVLLTFFTTW